MFGAKSSSRNGIRGSSRPGLMATSGRLDDNLKTVLIIISGCSLVALFALVVMRSQLVAEVAETSDLLAEQKSLVTDLRKRLSETSSKLNSERRRLSDLTVQRDEEHAESVHTIEVLHEKIDSFKISLNACQADHADVQGTSESLQQELKIEVEECRADVIDLQKDLATVQNSLKRQHAQTLDWKDSYDGEFKSHAITQSTLTDVREELRDCKDANHAARAHSHPPAPTAGTADTESRAGRAASETAGPPGETQRPKRQASVDSGPRRVNAVSKDPPRHTHPKHVEMDDDPMDQPHYHHDQLYQDEPHGVLDGGQHQQGDSQREYHGDVPVHVETDHNEHHRLTDLDYELMHHYHHLQAHGHHYDHIYDESLLYEPKHNTVADAQPQLEYSEQDVQETEAGELPPEESLRIHKMRRRPPAVETVDPDEVQETLS